MGNRTKEDELYREMCRVVGKVVLEKQAMETVINALVK
ncbi:TPA: DUF2767 family protein [Shigella sonnei]|nr:MULTISPECIES: DUF2767 family protein [Enterobacteriaceae]HBN4083440.1 DUF2767 family protein [Escherichia coli O25b:H4-ST131]EAA0820743.1 hypothetical protein [Shigella sonnei]EAB9643103.1 DUF2767 family protein [Shigella sonnei]EFQ0312689.1 DUF2767 family protein [Shigella sonnei]EFQ0742743.1 DUF2767 family protein [Shigella sonnei]